MGDFNKLIYHPKFGLGRVIAVKGGTCLIYFFNENPYLHDGDGNQPDCHCRFLPTCMLPVYKINRTPLRLYVERRRNET